MICEKPYVSMGMVFRCGQCHPCLVQRSRVWKHRLMLEAMLHSENCFLTLTYRDECLSQVWWSKDGSGKNIQLRPSLNPVHLQRFMKRLRKWAAPAALRFFAVGEYGEKTWRPHYHIVVFGLRTCERGRTKKDIQGRVDPYNCCDRCRSIGKLWGMGDIELGMANPESMGYVSGYVLKGIFNEKSADKLRGRFPEFSRKSNRPGIGAGFMDVLADSLVEYGVGRDVPCALAHGKSLFPLTRYLRNKLRVLVGREEGCPDEILFEMAQTMQELRENAHIGTFEDWKVFAANAVMAGAANVKARSEVYRAKRAI